MRSRDRRGRGIRGPFTPATVPISRSRAEMFDELVLEAVERILTALPELEDVDVVVEEVPAAPRLSGAPDPVALGRVQLPSRGSPAQIVVHRRPIELRSSPGVEREDLVGDVVAELVAELFGLSPGQVDPDYRGDR